MVETFGCIIGKQYRRSAEPGWWLYHHNAICLILCGWVLNVTTFTLEPEAQRTDRCWWIQETGKTPEIPTGQGPTQRSTCTVFPTTLTLLVARSYLNTSMTITATSQNFHHHFFCICLNTSTETSHGEAFWAVCKRPVTMSSWRHSQCEKVALNPAPLTDASETNLIHRMWPVTEV